MSGRRTLPAAVIKILVLLIVVPVLSFQPAMAVKGLFDRSLRLGTSEVSASTTYNFQFDYTVNAQLGSIRFEFCTNNPIPFTACNAPSGFDISSATLSDQTGETGFTIDAGNVTANEMLITRIPAVATPQTATYEFDGVVNPDTDGSYFVRIYTYSTDDGTGPTVEEAGIAFAVVELFDVTAQVPPYLLFCVGLTISSHDCSTASGNLIDFGVLESSSPSTASSQMTAATNAIDGVAITVIGTTMTSGIHSISALSTRGTSTPGTEQFGINLRNNATPNIGQEPTGTGDITPVGDYNFPNEFVFNSGDIVASTTGTTHLNTLTVSYLTNIRPDQEPGIYTSTLTYIATATF